MSPRALELQNGCALQPSLSTNPGFVVRANAWLAALQAILGIAVTLTTFVLQAIKVDNCRPLTILVVVAFATGMALIILAYVAQAYAINGKLTKVAAATIAGASIHFIVLVTFTAFALPSDKIMYTTACLAALKPAAKWATYLPAVSSAILMLVSVALLISCLFAARQLQIKLKCSIFRELYNTMRIYRGIGCMFVSGLLCASISIVLLVLAAVGGFDIGLCWLVQWATMSRMLTTSLWHRLHTDSTAHKHKFWRTYAYYSGYLRYNRDTDNIFTTRT
ncbi:hypothetical protein GGF42_001753 [Coemansia sp. RSA 2424]|nr:hypothetical protein GGF42_001753 [Coemansia sp. RSA 2424]